MNRWIVCAIIAAAACGRSDSERVATPQEFSATLAEVVAARAVECEGATPPYAAELKLQIGGMYAVFDDAVRAGRLRYDAVGARACLERFEGGSCEGWIGGWMDPRCTTAVFRPTVALGGSCTGDYECADGWCTGAFDACGTCQPWRDLGDTCGTICEPGLLCVGSTHGGCPADYVCLDGRCAEPRPPGGVNEPCSEAWPWCQPELLCDSTSTCRRLGLVGERCAQSWECEWGLDCEGGACAEVLPLPPPSCGGTCVPGTECDGSRCVAWPTVGEPCGNYYPCLASWCGPSGRCESYVHVGMPCVADSGCAPGLMCEAGTCGPPRAACVQ
jgi:hypothetical protein